MGPAQLPAEQIGMEQLYIRDAQTRQPTPVSGVSGVDDEFLQAAAVGYAPMTFTQVANNTTVPDWITPHIGVSRKSTLISRFAFSSAGANATIRFILYDASDNQVVSEVYNIEATSFASGGLYLAKMYNIPTYGALEAAVYLETLSAGGIDIHLAAV